MPPEAGPAARAAPPAEPGRATTVGPIDRPSRTSRTGRSGSLTSSGLVPWGVATPPATGANRRIVPAVEMSGTPAAAGVGGLGDRSASADPAGSGAGATGGIEERAGGDPATDVGSAARPDERSVGAVRTPAARAGWVVAGIAEPDMDDGGDDAEPDVDDGGDDAERRTTVAAAPASAPTVPAAVGPPGADELEPVDRAAGPSMPGIAGSPARLRGASSPARDDGDPVSVGEPVTMPGRPAGAAGVGAGGDAAAPLDRPTVGDVAGPVRSIRASRGGTGNRAADRTRATTDRRMKRPGRHPLRVASSLDPVAAGSPVRGRVPGTAGRSRDPSINGPRLSGFTRCAGPSAARGAAGDGTGWAAGAPEPVGLGETPAGRPPDHRRRIADTDGAAGDVPRSGAARFGAGGAVRMARGP